MTGRKVWAAADNSGKLRLRFLDFFFRRQFVSENVSSLPEIGVHMDGGVKIIDGLVPLTRRNQTDGVKKIVHRPVRLMTRSRFVMTESLLPFSFILLHKSP